MPGILRHLRGRGPTWLATSLLMAERNEAPKHASMTMDIKRTSTFAELFTNQDLQGLRTAQRNTNSI